MGLDIVAKDPFFLAFPDELLAEGKKLGEFFLSLLIRMIGKTPGNLFDVYRYLAWFAVVYTQNITNDLRKLFRYIDGTGFEALQLIVIVGPPVLNKSVEELLFIFKVMINESV
jgi:hypothetical protein